ncbi:hypothetical protein NP233_g11007 [Leucocoprinus birnbaumii]|uniref:Uncharacterized protein n=1 Tax=Leucocoprinus birnbaumii TaxID=56174 RepID=A0AAD5YRC4_9AGAR|nr:hypothetical protein NP233_g11007 [Leucocoprinus birnbaumii]
MSELPKDKKKARKAPAKRMCNCRICHYRSTPILLKTWKRHQALMAEEQRAVARHHVTQSLGQAMAPDSVEAGGLGTGSGSDQGVAGGSAEPHNDSFFSAQDFKPVLQATPDNDGVSHQPSPSGLRNSPTSGGETAGLPPQPTTLPPENTNLPPQLENDTAATNAGSGDSQAQVPPPGLDDLDEFLNDAEPETRINITRSDKVMTDKFIRMLEDARLDDSNLSLDDIVRLQNPSTTSPRITTDLSEKYSLKYYLDTMSSADLSYVNVIATSNKLQEEQKTGLTYDMFPLEYNTQGFRKAQEIRKDFEKIDFERNVSQFTPVREFNEMIDGIVDERCRQREADEATEAGTAQRVIHAPRALLPKTPIIIGIDLAAGVQNVAEHILVTFPHYLSRPNSVARENVEHSLLTAQALHPKFQLGNLETRQAIFTASGDVLRALGNKAFLALEQEHAELCRRYKQLACDFDAHETAQHHTVHTLSTSQSPNDTSAPSGSIDTAQADSTIFYRYHLPGGYKAWGTRKHDKGMKMPAKFPRDMAFWSKLDWMATRQSGKTKPPNSSFIVDETGASLPEEEKKAICNQFCDECTEIAQHMEYRWTWKNVSSEFKGHLFAVLEQKYKYLGLCLDHWKVLELGQEIYHNWVSNHVEHYSVQNLFCLDHQKAKQHLASAGIEVVDEDNSPPPAEEPGSSVATQSQFVMSLAHGPQTVQVGSTVFPDNKGADEGVIGHQQAEEEEDEEWFLRPSFHDTHASDNHDNTPPGYYNPGRRRQYASQHFYRRVGTPSSSSSSSSSPTSAYSHRRSSQEHRSLGSPPLASSRVRAHVEDPISPTFQSPTISPANGGGCPDALPSPTAATIGATNYSSTGEIPPQLDAPVALPMSLHPAPANTGPIDPVLVANLLVTKKPLSSSEVPSDYDPKLWEGIAHLLADQNRVYKPKPSDKSPQNLAGKDWVANLGSNPHNKVKDFVEYWRTMSHELKCSYFNKSEAMGFKVTPKATRKTKAGGPAKVGQYSNQLLWLTFFLENNLRFSKDKKPNSRHSFNMILATTLTIMLSFLFLTLIHALKTFVSHDSRMTLPYSDSLDTDILALVLLSTISHRFWPSRIVFGPSHIIFGPSPIILSSQL